LNTSSGRYTVSFRLSREMTTVMFTGSAPVKADAAVMLSQKSSGKTCEMEAFFVALLQLGAALAFGAAGCVAFVTFGPHTTDTVAFVAFVEFVAFDAFVAAVALARTLRHAWPAGQAPAAVHSSWHSAAPPGAGATHE